VHFATSRPLYLVRSQNAPRGTVLEAICFLAASWSFRALSLVPVWILAAISGMRRMSPRCLISLIYERRPCCCCRAYVQPSTMPPHPLPGTLKTPGSPPVTLFLVRIPTQEDCERIPFSASCCHALTSTLRALFASCFEIPVTPPPLEFSQARADDLPRLVPSSWSACMNRILSLSQSQLRRPCFPDVSHIPPEA